MNDEEFRENCKAFANDIIAFHSGWKKSLTVPTDWVGIMEDNRQLDTAALLYIAANMPSSNEGAKKPCTFCNNTEPDITTSHYFYIDSAQKQLVNVCDGEKTRAAIRYCPVCGRKL